MEEKLDQEIIDIITAHNITEVGTLVKKLPPKIYSRIFWGTSRKDFKIGYHELRKILPSAKFSILAKLYPQVVFRTENKLTEFILEIETAMNKKNGLVEVKGTKPLFVRRIFDNKTKKPNGRPLEVIEWRRYINVGGDPLADLKTTVLTGLALISERFVCSQCMALSQYEYQIGFVCLNCRSIVNPTYTKWEEQKKRNVKYVAKHNSAGK